MDNHCHWRPNVPDAPDAPDAPGAPNVPDAPGAPDVKLGVMSSLASRSTASTSSTVAHARIAPAIVWAEGVGRNAGRRGKAPGKAPPPPGIAKPRAPAEGSIAEKWKTRAR